jgi:hypothetical protein
LTHITRTPIPPYLYETICDHLGQDEALGTLASIQCLSKLSYNLATHWIYWKADIVLSSSTTATLPQSIDLKDKEVLSLAKGIIKERKGMKGDRSNFEPKLSGIYQSAWLMSARSVTIKSWPSQQVLRDACTTFTKFRRALPDARLFGAKVTRVRIEASALSDPATLGDGIVGANILASMLSNGKYNVCITMPPSSRPGYDCINVRFVAKCFVAQSIIYHDITFQQLPFGSMRTMQHRYLFRLLEGTSWLFTFILDASPQ